MKIAGANFGQATLRRTAMAVLFGSFREQSDHTC